MLPSTMSTLCWILWNPWQSFPGSPIGIKSAVGQMAFWEDLASEMSKGRRGVDFVTIDGGEGGTGAAPLVFSDHVALPFKQGFSRVYQTFHRHGLCDKVVFWGAGKLGFPDAAITAFALGCDGVMLAREAMLSIGCIQAQHCHTGNVQPASPRRASG